MVAEIKWHIYGTKLRHCHPMYTTVHNGIQLWISSATLKTVIPTPLTHVCISLFSVEKC